MRLSYNGGLHGPRTRPLLSHIPGVYFLIFHCPAKSRSQPKPAPANGSFRRLPEEAEGPALAVVLLSVKDVGGTARVAHSLENPAVTIRA